MSIEKQLELEQAMIDSGASAYRTRQREAEQGGRGAELDYSSRLIREFVLPLSEHLKEWLCTIPKGARTLGRAKGLLRMLPEDTAVFIALRAVFNSFTIERTVAGLAANIGKMIEDEVRFTRFQETHKDYYDSIIEDFKRKSTIDYRHKQRVMTHSANEKGDMWVAWTAVEKIDVGTRLLDLILVHTDLCVKRTRIQNNKNVVEITPAEGTLKWIDEHEEIKQFMFPDRMPCVIVPDEWTAINQGGYYSPVLRSNVPMIKTQLPKEFRQTADLSNVMRSINTVQNVPWAVNKEVLAIMKIVWEKNLGIGMPASEQLKPGPCPVDGIKVEDMTLSQQELFQDWKHEASATYTAERERVAQAFQASRIVRMAHEYQQYDAFWYVWYADFRGRLYTATAGFSPQGPDLAKGLLKFQRGKRLGERGLYWLKVHGANRYGYDKDTYDGRVAWVDARHDEFIRAAADPLSHRDTWANADKPWQFLAFLFEYGEAHSLANAGVQPHEYVSHLAVGLDGSCNGLQNFSAMLRDSVGGAATNLVPSDKPRDIYAQVAEVAVRKVRDWLLANENVSYNRKDFSTDEALQYAVEDHALQVRIAKLWLTFGVDRKLCKRPVMTLPYGATRQSCTQYLFAEIVARNKTHFPKGRNFKAASWMTAFVWSAIAEVVVAASHAMSWLQKSASAMNKIGEPIKWTTADGFVAWSDPKVIETTQIKTQLQGNFQIRVGHITNEIDKHKQRNGISPNFVHSYDATHLRMTVVNCAEEGITDLMLIHDDYGTHAADTDAMHRIIRQTFVDLYQDWKPLDQFRDEQEAQGATLPSLPASGTLVLDQVKESLYFFG